MKGPPPPQVTTGGPPRQEERDSGTEGSRVYFASARLGHCPSRAEAALVFRLLSEPSLLSFHASPFSCSLCSAGARKNRRRPLKRDHSRGSSQQPPPPSPPHTHPTPTHLSPLPLSKTSPGLDGAARGHAAKLQLPGAPSDAASDVGNASHHTTPLPPQAVSSSHTLLNQRAVSPANA